MPVRVPALVIAIGVLGACGPEPFERVDAGLTPQRDAAIADAAVIAPDAKTVACPPGLPASFGDLGTVTTTKNGPGSPANYDSYNVFARLLGNERWFFAMNLFEGRGTFVSGFQLNNTYDITGQDTVEPTCALCINLFADVDTTPGGPSLHMFAQKGRLIVTSKSTDQTQVSGRLEDVIFEAIEIVYDDQSIACGDIDDPVCGNSICLNHRCGRQQLLAGCDTSIKSMTF